MSNYFTDQRVHSAQFSVDFDTADAEVVLIRPVPIDVLNIRIVLLEATSVAASVVTVGTREADDAAGASVVTSYGTFSLASGLATNTAYVVEIAGVDADVVGTDASQVAEVTTGRVLGYQTNLPGVIEVNPGQAFIVQSDGAGTGGNALVFVEYVEQGPDNERATITEIAFTRA